MEKAIKNIIADNYREFLPSCAGIATKMGVKYTTVYCWLRGRNLMSMARFIEFCTVNGLNPVTEFNDIYEKSKGVKHAK